MSVLSTGLTERLAVRHPFVCAQVAAALCLGADGVWVGTRLVASREAQVHPEHHRRLVASTGEDTVLSRIFGPEWPEFNPMRVQRNRVVAEWNDRPAEVPTDLTGLDQVGTTDFSGLPSSRTAGRG